MGLRVNTMVPHIGLVDWSPSRKSLLCSREVEGGGKIGVMLESTFVTSEKGLSSSIGLVDISAPWACFGGVSWVGIEDGYPPFQGLISNEKHTVLPVEHLTYEPYR